MEEESVVLWKGEEWAVLLEEEGWDVLSVVLDDPQRLELWAFEGEVASIQQQELREL